MNLFKRETTVDSIIADLRAPINKLESLIDSSNNQIVDNQSEVYRLTAENIELTKSVTRASKVKSNLSTLLELE